MSELYPLPSPHVLYEPSLQLENRIPIPLPLPSSGKNSEAIRHWLADEHNFYLKGIKQKLADAVQHIPFPKFLEEIRAVGTQVNEALEDNPYLVLWDQKSHASKRWAHALMQPAIVAPATLSMYTRKEEGILQALREHNMHTILVPDDAIYRGNQISEAVYVPLWNLLQQVNYPEQVHLILAVPYVTKIFRWMAENRWNDNKIKTTLISTQEMPDIWSTLTKDEAQYITRLGHINKLQKGDDPQDVQFQGSHGDALVTFDHKIGDYHSVHAPILASVGIDVRRSREPYKVKGTPYYEMEQEEYGFNPLDKPLSNR